MAGGIDAARHATNNDQPLRGEVARQTLGHAGAIGRGVARPNHGDAGLGQHVGIAADAEDQRRIVDFLETRWIRRIFHREQGDVRRGGLGDLFPRQFRRLACRQRLGRNGLNAGALEFGQGSAEDGLWRAEMLNQFARLRRAEAGGQRDGQPLQKVSRGGGHCGIRQITLRADPN